MTALAKGLTLDLYVKDPLPCGRKGCDYLSQVHLEFANEFPSGVERGYVDLCIVHLHDFLDTYLIDGYTVAEGTYE